jgi:hypothetical protein
MNRSVHQVFVGIFALAAAAASPAIFAQLPPPVNPTTGVAPVAPTTPVSAEQAARQRLLAVIQKQGVQLDSVEVDLVLNGDAAQLGAVVQEAVRVIEARAVAQVATAPQPTTTAGVVGTAPAVAPVDVGIGAIAPLGPIAPIASPVSSSPVFDVAIAEIIAAVVTQPALVATVSASVVAVKPEAAPVVQQAVVAAVQQIQQVQQAAQTGNQVDVAPEVLAQAREIAPITNEQIETITQGVEQVVEQAVETATAPQDNTAAPTVVAVVEQEDADLAPQVDDTPDEPVSPN